ncbi:class F sortase [Streptomyces sp. enrichment culture]|uniref:class F sortase n=1 Tax=Streptomyces sp. enrichment culture TaxID=1795815 RepID=UPI003F55F9DC
MAEGGRWRAGAAVTSAVLAAALGLACGAPETAAPPPDFGPSAPARAAPSAGPSESAASAGPDSDGPREAARPRRILVPRIGLDARIEPVGVSGDGTMTVPEDPAVAGWYRFGPAPGAGRGSAVLAGHVDDETGDLGAFAALYEVRRGDRVEVRRGGAGPVVHRVVSRRTVPQDELDPSVFRREGDPVLTLITCAPPFLPDRGGYQSNLVVTALPTGGP